MVGASIMIEELRDPDAEGFIREIDGVVKKFPHFSETQRLSCFMILAAEIASYRCLGDIDKFRCYFDHIHEFTKELEEKSIWARNSQSGQR